MFHKPYNESEERVIRILSHEDDHTPAKQSRDFSYSEIAYWLNFFLKQYNKGTRKARGVYGFLKRESS
jgi:hypothetical protein